MTRAATTTIAALALTAFGCALDDAAPECDTEPAARATLLINEVMASNVLTTTDADGDPSGWVELYNYGDRPVPLCGYGLSDDASKPHRARLAADAVVEPGGHVLLWLSGKKAPGLINHVPFELDRAGGDILLSDRDGAVLDHVRYGAQATDFSAAREPDGSPRWLIEWHPTPGASNPPGDGPVGERIPREPELIPAAGDLTGEILGYDLIPEIGLRLERAQVERLRSNPHAYAPGFLVFRDREYGPVGIRLQGQSSFQPLDDKPSFRIKIDEYADGARFFGLDDLTLNNMDDDYSMMRERLAYLVARQIGPAPRCNHAVLTVNGADYGLYSNVETVERNLISRWFDDASGPLFEAAGADFRDDHIDRFERKSGPDDRSKLFAVAAALANPNPDAAISEVSEHLAIDAFLDFWAMEVVVGQFDAFPYSAPGDDYFVYVDPRTDKLWFLPWGMDETFYSSAFDPKQVSSLLASTCLASASCRSRFIESVWAVLDLTEEMDLVKERERVSAQIEPHVAADPRKPYDDATVGEFQMHIYRFLRGRRASLERALSGNDE